MHNIESVNSMSVETFVETFADVFEHSSWVAEHAYAALPVKDRLHLHAVMTAAVEQSPATAKLRLLRQHPELAGRFKEKVSLTANSTKEQSQAGLTHCHAAQLQQLLDYNERYNDKFTFPFIVAVKGLTVDAIISTMARRISHTYEQEFIQALQQVYRIAEFRLAEIVCD